MATSTEHPEDPAVRIRERLNNILAVLSKPMKHAVDCELIGKAPKIRLYKVERPEIEPWDFEPAADRRP